MRQLANVRKADKARGDDLTLTRWIKTPGRHKSGKAVAPVAETATGTRFPTRVLPVAAMTSILVSGHSNVKIGRDVRKGRFKGYWIYTLSLQERATCPRSCEHWQTCYGNNMPFAKRVDHTDPAFLPTLEAEIERLLKRHKTGVLVRLHALGDFYSEHYVKWWGDQLRKHPRLAVFGYTARDNSDPIGEAVIHLRHVMWDRFAVRSSNGARHNKATVSIRAEEDCPTSAFVCPEQTGKTRCCATCGACWSTTKTVAFLEH